MDMCICMYVCMYVCMYNENIQLNELCWNIIN